MSKLSDFYAHRNKMLQDKGQFEIEQKWEALEEKLLCEELLPAIGYALKPLLKDVKTQLTINVNLKSASNLNGNLNCSKELEHYAS